MIAFRQLANPASEETRKSARRGVRHVLEWLPLIAFTGILGFQLLGPVPFGLANNNDFARILGRLNLWPAPQFVNAEHPYFTYFVNDYVESDRHWDSGVPTSEWLIAALAKKIAHIVLPPGTFQLRIMGFLHAGILMLALIIFLRALRTRALWVQWAGGLLLVFIWTDLRYVQQFNTAYTDTGAVLALAVVFAIAVHCLLVSARWPWAVSFTLAGCFLLATKTQHATTLPFLMGIGLVEAFRASRKTDRAVWLAAPLAFVATTVWMIARTPNDYRAAPAFTLVFYKLAVLSPDPKSVLAEFHMPANEFERYVGHYAYEPIVPDDAGFRKRIVSLVSLSSLSRFYWRHPDILGKVLLFDFRGSAPDIDLSQEGVYGHLREIDVRSGRHPFELTYWSRFRHRLFALAPFHLIYFFGLIILSAGFWLVSPGLRRLLPIWPVAVVAALVAIPSFLFASLLDAIETARHLVFFQTATDLTIFSVALSGLVAVEELVKRRTPGRRPAQIQPARTARPLIPVKVRMGLLCGAAVLILVLQNGNGDRAANEDLDDTSGEIEYSGKWTHALLPSAANGTTSFSADPAASARLSFRGTEIVWIYARAWNRGIASVTIDGVPYGEVDQYSPTIVWQARTTFAGLKPGRHVIEVRATGYKDAQATDQYIDLDALIIR